MKDEQYVTKSEFAHFEIKMQLLVLGVFLGLQLDIPAEISAPAGLAFIARSLWTLRR